MAVHGLHHLVLLVDDVPSGESFYRELFDMEVLFREGSLDGSPGTLPDDVDWAAAIEAGVTPYMSFLGRDDLYLGLGAADGDPPGGCVDHVALAVDEDAFEGITERAKALGCSVEENTDHHRTFRDLQGVEWELNTGPRPPSPAFDELDV